MSWQSKIAVACGHAKTLFLSRSGIVVIAAFLMLLAPLLDAVYIKLFGANVVSYDQWELVPVLEKLYDGSLGFGDLFAQHNEHRIFFPRLIMLALAYLTRYNNVAEMYASWAVMAVTIILIFAIYRKKLGTSITTLVQFIPVVWIFYTLRQNENILWGWQIQVFLCILGLVSSIYFLDRAKGFDANFALAIICGIVSSFSFVNGLLVWPVGLVFIIISNSKDRIRFSLAYVLAGIFVIAAFFYQWVYPQNPQSIIYAQNPVSTMLQYVLINVGSPLAFEMGNAIAAGVILLVLLLMAVTAVVYKRAVAENAPWLAFILFSLLSTASFASGRSRLGIEQALTSRYVSFTLFLVIGIYMIATYLYNNRDKNSDRFSSILYGMVISMVLLGIVNGYLGGIHVGDKVLEGREQMADALAHYRTANDSALQTLYPDADIVRVRATILEKYKLNVFS